MVHAISRAQMSFPKIPIHVICYDLIYESVNRMLVKAKDLLNFCMIVY